MASVDGANRLIAKVICAGLAGTVGFAGIAGAIEGVNSNNGLVGILGLVFGVAFLVTAWRVLTE